MSQRAPLPSVTDHAVLRYLEHARGLDIDAIRTHIASLVARGVAAQGDAVVVEGVKFKLRGNVVVTVMARRWPTIKPMENEHDM